MKKDTQKTTLLIKTDKRTKIQAQRTAQKLGLPLGTIINALLRQFVLQKEITLSAKRPQPDLKRAIDELRRGEGERSSDTTEALFDEITKS